MTLAVRDAVAPMSEAEARSLTDEIKTDLSALWEKVIRAWQGKAWQALGYSSWDAYLDGELGEYRVKLPRAERREVVASMSEAGMSTRAIAAAVGTSKSLVADDLSESVQNWTPEPRIHDAEAHSPEVHETEVLVGELVEEWPGEIKREPTEWSRAVQKVSKEVPMEALSDGQVEELRGAAEFLLNYCNGELTLRERRNQK